MHRPSTHRWCRLEVLSLLIASMMGVASVSYAQGSGTLEPPPTVQPPKKAPSKRTPKAPPAPPAEPAPASEPAPSSTPPAEPPPPVEPPAPAPVEPPAADAPAASQPVTPPALEPGAPVSEPPPAPAAGSDSLIERVQGDEDVRMGRLRVQYDAAMASAELKMQSGDYRGAELSVLEAKRALDRDGMLLSPAARDELASKADKLLERINENRVEQNRERNDAATKKAQDEASTQRVAEQQKRQEQIRNRLLRVRELQMELKYDEALEILDEILFMDPANPAALTLRDVIESARMYRKYSDVQRRRNFGYSELRLEDAEANVPPRRNVGKDGPKSLNGALVYPEDWGQITLYRRRFGVNGWVRTENDAAIARMLDGKIGVGDYPATTLETALENWQSVAGVPIYVNWTALEKNDIKKDTQISEIRIPKMADNSKYQMSRKDLLDRILQQSGGEGGLDDNKMPRVEVINGYVLVTTLEDLQKSQDARLPRVYDIRDLVFKETNFISTGIPGGGGGGGSGGGGSGGGGSGGGGGGSGGGGFGGGGGGGSGGGGSGGGGGGGGGSSVTTDPEREKTIQERVDKIKTLIQRVVDPNYWDSDSAKMEDFDQKLIITALPETHRHLIDLLTQIRAVTALEIGIEVRVLQINSEWFEQIGIDLDMYFNTNSALYDAARTADPNMGLRDFFFQGTSVRPGANTLKNPVVFGGIGGSDITDVNQIATGSAIGTATAPISNSIAYQQGSVGPPLGVLKRGDQYANGQTSTGFGPVQMQQEGLRLTDTLAAGGISSVMGLAALANPAMTVGMTFLDDVQVDLLVQATQADQRNAILTAPRLTLLNGQQSAIAIGRTVYYVSGFTPGTGNSTGVPITTPFNGGISMTLQAVASADRRYVSMTVQFQDLNLEGFDSQDVQQSVAGGGTGGGGAATSRNTIQLPKFRNTSINTSVSVPDKGTVMLGGQKFTTDYEVEVGVPVLSKIPVVNRFFTNRVNSKVENNLLLLIRPEIMIQAESEDKLFPGLLGQRDEVAGDSQAP